MTTEAEMDQTAVNILEANIWKADHAIQDYFMDHDLKEIKIARYYLATREGPDGDDEFEDDEGSFSKGTSPQHAVILTAKHFKMTRYEVARILLSFIPVVKH